MPQLTPQLTQRSSRKPLNFGLLKTRSFAPPEVRVEAAWVGLTRDAALSMTEAVMISSVFMAFHPKYAWLRFTLCEENYSRPYTINGHNQMLPELLIHLWFFVDSSG